MYVCICIYIYNIKHIFIYAFYILYIYALHTHIEYMYISIYAYTVWNKWPSFTSRRDCMIRAHVHAPKCLHVYVLRVQVCTHSYMHNYTYRHSCVMYVCVHMLTHTCIHVKCIGVIFRLQEPAFVYTYTCCTYTRDKKQRKENFK
jgi:hypothetical protein